jgi:urea transporter
MPVPGFWLFVELCLRGISQVYFQSNPFTGLLMLTGLFVQSPRVAVHGVLSVVCGNLIAYLLGMDKGMIKAGLFGYNGTSGGLSKTGLRYKSLLTRCLLVRSRIGWSCYSYVSYARDAL